MVLLYSAAKMMIAPHLDGVVKLTHDGGQSWSDIPSLSQDEFRPYIQVLSIAALDSNHYLMIRRQPDIEDVLVETADGGKSWKLVHVRNDSTNRELPRQVLVHAQEYWVFGMELVNRQQGGGYGIPMTLHSKDGQTWSHGANGGLHEFGRCNQQGCYLYDGTAEISYTDQPKYWAMRQDFSFSKVWAVTGSRACTISSVTECGPALVTDKPQASVWGPGGSRFHMKPPKLINFAFAEGCTACGVKAIWPDPGLDWHGQIVANLKIAADGTVANVSLEGTTTNSFVAHQISDQIAHWKFEVPQEAPKWQTSVSLDVRCLDLPQAPTIGGCWLTPGKQPS
jgi:hypothetical protein